MSRARQSLRKETSRTADKAVVVGIVVVVVVVGGGGGGIVVVAVGENCRHLIRRKGIRVVMSSVNLSANLSGNLTERGGDLTGRGRGKAIGEGLISRSTDAFTQLYTQ